VASQQDLKRRIRSVRNTRKITKAMELVAGARLRRAEARIQAMRPYAERMRELMIGTARAAGPASSRLPLLEVRTEVTTTAIVALTGDRGLAGPFNSQILRRAFALEREVRAAGGTPRWLVAGKKGRSTLAFRRYEVAGAWVGFTDKPAYTDAAAMAHRVIELFVEREIDSVVLVYNRYYSPLTQRVETIDLLPIPRSLLEEGEEGAAKSPYEIALEGDIIYEPEPEEILERLLPTYVETTIYRALLESAASELGARMTAMRNASKNANELIDRLTLDMNRARQAEITQEILEVVAGADALEYG
jgi:F-type H+-transporting ATPase subunit gamma